MYRNISPFKIVNIYNDKTNMYFHQPLQYNQDATKGTISCFELQPDPLGHVSASHVP